MKSKIFTLFAAFVLLFSAQASAQTNGDVNDDGKVDEQDIAAILEIMQQAGGVKEQTKYYWYCGQTKPTSMANNPTQDEITDGTSDTDFKPNTWHPLTKDATSISKTITGGTSGIEWYVAVPTSFGFKPTASDLTTPDNAWETDNTISINNIEYTVWRPGSTGTRRAVYMAKEQTKYYWYVGQENPASIDDITKLEGIQQVTDYPSTYEYQNTSGKRGYAYVILHNSKTLTAVEKVSQATVNFTTDTTSIPNYTIYKTTVGMAINGVMVITIK